MRNNLIVNILQHFPPIIMAYHKIRHETKEAVKPHLTSYRYEADGKAYGD